MGPPTEWIAAGGVVGLMAINITFVLAILRSYQTRQTATETRTLHQDKLILSLQRQHFVCEQRTNILIWTLQSNGIKVPATIWEEGGDPHSE